MEHFNEELIEKTLLWSKKRLGSSIDAEELTQQILCEAISSMRANEKRGRELSSFFSWYWRIAENQLNIFLRLKYSPAVSIDELSLVSYDTADSELLHDDEIKALNYSISRLSRQHREMIISYYLREKSLGEIAAELGVPIGTIKRRLFDARENVKRSIDTMKTIGRSAYAPAELSLIGSLAAPNYAEKLNDLIVKQILVSCRNNPKAIQEISEEIAVAPVYFEEKLEYLVENKFLKEIRSGKYLTDIVILPEQLWVDFQTECAAIYDGIAPKLRDILLGIEDKLRAFDFIGNRLPTERLMWLGYIAAASKLSDIMVEKFSRLKGVPNGNGKNYRYMGRVILPDENIKYPPECRQISWSNMHFNFRTAEYRQITYADLFDAPPFEDRENVLNQSNILLFMQLAEQPDRPLTELEEAMCAELISDGFLEKRSCGLYPTLPVISCNVLGNIEQLIYDSVAPLSSEYVEKLASLGDKMLLPHIRTELYEEYVNWVMRNAFFPLGYVLQWAMCDEVEAGHLELPKENTRSSLAAAVYFRK